MVKREYPQSYIKLNTTLQAVAVRVTINKPVTICCVYLPPKDKVRYNQLVSLVKELPAPFLLLGDFNAHNMIWGCTKTKARGRKIERLLEKQNLCLFNRGTPTFLYRDGKQSALDLSICHPSIFADFDWRVHDDPLGSDHLPIELQTVKRNNNREQTERWRTNKADWEQYQALCGTVFEPWETVKEKQDPTQYFTETLREVSTKCIPRTSKTSSSKPCIWYNDECRDARKKRRTALRKLKRNMSFDNAIAYSKEKAKTRLTYNNAKRESFREFVNTIDSSTPLKKVYDKVKRLNGRPASTVNHLKVGNETKETSKEIADTLADQYSKVSSNANYSDKFLRWKEREEKEAVVFDEKSEEAYNRIFTLEELKHALHQAKDSSPGPDDLHYQMLKHLPEKQLDLLLEIFNQIWTTGDYPTSWSEAIVVPIPKPGKDTSMASSYRPIAMTSCLAKTLERMVNNRLVWYLETNCKGGSQIPQYTNQRLQDEKDTLTPYQAGFRKGRSTTDHLVRLESFVREGFANKQHVVAVFFDLEKAYDTTWKFGILKDLKKMGLGGRLTRFVKGFLTNRTFRVRSGATMSKSAEQENGVPQGCVLSVTLFGIKINSIVKNCVYDVECCLYVDDFVIYCRSARMDYIERKLRNTLKNLETWSDENGFKFSQSKTKCVHFCRRKCEESPVLSLNGQQLTVETEYKFLGLIFDHRLSFQAHVEYLRKKCQKAMNLLKMLSHSSWGADREILLTLYNTYILSRLDYGCIVYSSAAEPDLKRLDPIQNQGLRLCLGAFRSSPKVSLCVEAGIPPLALRRRKLSLQYAIRVMAQEKNPTHDTIFTEDLSVFDRRPNAKKPYAVTARTLLSEVEITPDMVMKVGPAKSPPWTVATPVILFDLAKNKKGETEQSVFIKNLETIRKKYKGYNEVYTDGSKDGKRVGFAAHTPLGDRLGALHGKSTIFTAEGYAVRSGFEWIRVSGRNKFILFSDSKSFLEALNQHDPSNPLVQEVKELYSALVKQGKEVVLCWLPSHIGIEGNECADEAAKLALRRPPKPALIPSSDFFQVCRETMMKEWQIQWNCQRGNKLQAIEPSVGKKQDHRDLTRRESTRLARFRIGHSLLTHRHLMGARAPPLCQRCHVALTIRHLTLHCRATRRSRDKHLKGCKSMKKVFKKRSLKEILSFLRETQIFEKL